MKRLAAYLLLGLYMCGCAPVVPTLTPSLVGRWEQMAVRTVTHDLAGQLLEDSYDENEPGSVWLEFTAAGAVYFWLNGLAKPTGTTYAYRAGSLLFRDVSQGETAHPVVLFVPHRLIYQTHKEGSAGTEDVTFIYRR